LENVTIARDNWRGHHERLMYGERGLIVIECMKLKADLC